ncbi:coiled-coil domain-containing protein 137 [Cinnamomum micranthum f. kanehirae]|uniref:Coiled-coil domain-containing protein 137 n=1 Tax=Cinnamomum micranthum f. kanehirae TaxID=337451 RepID=A0A443NVE5_9MAGN|nr:coiled-coil domain-containing protein 137 [Cinnamomum micranthum f. kanehirae]
MGGKGQRRREKNFLAAHGDYTRLPPAPKASDLDKLPSKLRRLMDFLSPSKTTSTKKLQVHLKTSKDAKIGKCKEDVIGDQTLEHGSNRDTNTNMDKKGKKKRKRKAVDDLRFQKIDQGSTTTGLSKRERRKKFLEERRKKHKRGKTDDSQDFPMREEIRFGEVVEAPPKIAAFPKAKKTTLGASQERLRLQAVEAYRKRKGWVSRPGIHLPPIAADQSYNL